MAEECPSAEMAMRSDFLDDIDDCAGCSFLGPKDGDSDSCSSSSCSTAGAEPYADMKTQIEKNCCFFDDVDSKKSLRSDPGELQDSCQKDSVVIVTDDEEDIWPEPPTFETVTENENAILQEPVSTVNTVDTLLERILRERSSELDQLQNRSRLVTAGNARGNLCDFFTRSLEPTTSANDRERTLPDDVQNLVQRSIVTSTLRRHAFRSTLEQALASRLPAAGNQLPQSLQRNSARSNISGTSTPLLSSIIESDAASVTSSVIDQNDFSDAASDYEQIQRAVNVGVQMLSETIEEDLAQLHHLHVVSTALNADFRNDLERLVQQRAASVGGGEIVQSFIRSLPARQPQPQATSNITSNPHNASSLPISNRAQLNISNEISSLKSQMEKMKRMMQMSFEVQIDIQRAVRQEVAAVFGAFMQQMACQAAAGQPVHQTCAPIQNSTAVSAGSCVICLENQVDTLLYQCGHLCVCNGCGIQLKMQGHRCPICRAPIQDVIRAYQAQ